MNHVDVYLFDCVDVEYAKLCVLKLDLSIAFVKKIHNIRLVSVDMVLSSLYSAQEQRKKAVWNAEFRFKGRVYRRRPALSMDMFSGKQTNTTDRLRAVTGDEIFWGRLMHLENQICSHFNKDFSSAQIFQTPILNVPTYVAISIK